VIVLYRLFTRLVYVIIYPWARYQAARGKGTWRGRLGLDLPGQTVDLWLHAASVGEVRVLANLVAFLMKSRPQLRIHATAVTRTGVETARSLLPRRVSVSCFPLDTPPVMGAVLDRLHPRLMVVAETEIWPNLIRELSKRSVPIILVNGRMTESSQKKYRLIAGTLRLLLSTYERFFFKSEADRDRFLPFALPPEKSIVAGDMKFDAPPMLKSKEWVDAIRTEIGVGQEHFVLVAGSTRPGEEALLLDMHTTLRDKHPHLRLVLAPRHLERLDEIRRLLEERQTPYCLYGDGRRCEAIALVDRMGLLNDLYAAADLAFVGGTLVDIGGHNILEPVWARTPVVFGPSVENVAEAAEYIVNGNYGLKVRGAGELTDVVMRVIEGTTRFAVRDESDLTRSATAIVGEYILKRLTDV
jgi:3-deoxy-D-manno-octulosonic-acid transferase